MSVYGGCCGVRAVARKDETKWVLWQTITAAIVEPNVPF